MSDTEHYLQLLDIHRSKLRLLVQQRAGYDKNAVPFHIVYNIDIARAEIRQLKTYLNDVDDIPGIDFDVDATVTLIISRELYEQIKKIVYEYGIEI